MTDLGSFFLNRRPPPTPNREGEEILIHPETALREAVENVNGTELLKLLLQRMSHYQYPFQSADEDYHRTKTVVERMRNDLLHSFLQVNFSFPKRSLDIRTWNNLCACQKSESGTYGIYFLQCGDRAERSSDDGNGIIVAKSYTAEEFERTKFITDLAAFYLQIKCPKIRFIPRTNPEFSELQEATRKMFTVFPELYAFGGSRSPKKLFEKEGIMLIEFIPGKTLAECQRFLSYPDYVEIGKIFFLDLLINNSDRFPCRKTFPRPNSTSIQDHGNAGNIMFGTQYGDVFSIDPELKIRPENEWDEWKDQYINAVESVVVEVLSRQDQDYTYSSINDLFFKPIPGFEDILPSAIHDIHRWRDQPDIVQEGIAGVLQLLRIKLRNFPFPSAKVVIPSDNEERTWREFINKIAPRVMADLFQFITTSMPKQPPPFDAAIGFYDGFRFALDTAISGKRMIEGEVANDRGSHHLRFVLEIIQRLDVCCQENGLDTSSVSTPTLTRMTSARTISLRK